MCGRRERGHIALLDKAVLERGKDLACDTDVSLAFRADCGIAVHTHVKKRGTGYGHRDVPQTVWFGKDERAACTDLRP